MLRRYQTSGNKSKGPPSTPPPLSTEDLKKLVDKRYEYLQWTSCFLTPFLTFALVVAVLFDHYYPGVEGCGYVLGFSGGWSAALLYIAWLDKGFGTTKHYISIRIFVHGLGMALVGIYEIVMITRAFGCNDPNNFISGTSICTSGYLPILSVICYVGAYLLLMLIIFIFEGLLWKAAKMLQDKEKSAL